MYKASSLLATLGLAAAQSAAPSPVNVPVFGSYNSSSSFNSQTNSSQTGPSSSPYPPFSGSPFTKYNISAPGVNASFIPYGARLTNFFVADSNGVPQDIVLGYDTGEQYLNDTLGPHSYFGAVVGRYANRIKNGTFEIDGVTSHVPTNENKGADTLHGGSVGYDQSNWTVVAQTPSSITFQLYDNAAQGFPGAVVNLATYTLQVDESSGHPEFVSRLVSVPLTDETPIMLANHIYWVLGSFVNPNDTTVLNQTLWMPYAERTPLTDSILIPNGTIGLTAGTPLDFTSPKKIGKDIRSAVDVCGLGCTGYDTCFINDRPRYAAPDSADVTLLSLASPQTGIQMDYRSNNGAIQIFTCDAYNGTMLVKSDQQRGNSSVGVPQYGCVVGKSSHVAFRLLKQVANACDNSRVGGLDRRHQQPAVGSRRLPDLQPVVARLRELPGLFVQERHGRNAHLDTELQLM